MNPGTIGLFLIAIAVGALIVRLATRNRPSLRPWSLVAAAVIILLLAGLIGTFAAGFVSGWYGGIPD